MIACVAGVFVGGAGTRMGGIAKGLLRSPAGPTLVTRLTEILRAAGAPVVLVGARPEYEGLGIEQIPDAPGGIGPLGGLVALLEWAQPRAGAALAIAVDMPFVSAGLIARLVHESAGAAVLAPRRSGRWEPLCARYRVGDVLPLAREAARSNDHSLQRLLEKGAAVALPLAFDEERQLQDWDAPSDMA